MLEVTVSVSISRCLSWSKTVANTHGLAHMPRALLWGFLELPRKRLRSRVSGEAGAKDNWVMKRTWPCLHTVDGEVGGNVLMKVSGKVREVNQALLWPDPLAAHAGC